MQISCIIALRISIVLQQPHKQMLLGIVLATKTEATGNAVSTVCAQGFQRSVFTVQHQLLKADFASDSLTIQCKQLA